VGMFIRPRSRKGHENVSSLGNTALVPLMVKSVSRKNESYVNNGEEIIVHRPQD
jgi:hypothetical protein